MKCINEMSLKFPSRSANESFARITVTAFFSQLDPTVAETAEIKTAVSEAVTNAIVHGYKETLGTVFITAKIYKDEKIVVSIRDKGVGIEDIEKARTPLYTTVDTGERAGMGFTIMESFCDKLKISSRPGKGTKVTLTKYIKKREGK